MTAGAILAIALIGAAATWLGMEIFRRIVKARRAKRIRDQWASQWSGDAGGMPPPVLTPREQMRQHSEARGIALGWKLRAQPSSAWRGTGASKPHALNESADLDDPLSTAQRARRR